MRLVNFKLTEGFTTPILRPIQNNRGHSISKQNLLYVQNAKISSVIQKITYYSITWNNIIETLPYELESDSKSDKMLFDMYTQNFIAMEKEKELSKSNFRSF